MNEIYRVNGITMEREEYKEFLRQRNEKKFRNKIISNNFEETISFNECLENALNVRADIDKVKR